MTVTNNVQVTQTIAIVPNQNEYVTVVDLTQSNAGIINLTWLKIDLVSPLGFRSTLVQGLDFVAFSITNGTQVNFIKDIHDTNLYKSIIFYRQIPNTQVIDFQIETDYVTFQNNITNQLDLVTSEIQDSNGQIELLKNLNNNIISDFEAALNLKADLSYVNEQLVLKVDTALLGVPFGVATLNGAGVVPYSQLPVDISQPVLGLWDADLNITYPYDGSPQGFLQTNVGTNGDKWDCFVAGNTVLNGYTNWQVGDQPVYDNGWIARRNVNDVISVNSYSGVVILQTNDILENPVGLVNKWFTDDRAITAVTPLIDATADGLQSQIDAKVDKDVITTNGTFGNSSQTFTLIQNSEGLLKTITPINIQILSSAVTDFSTEVGNLTIGKADKIIPAVTNSIALLGFDGNLVNSAAQISTDGTLLSNSNSLIPTQAAVKTYADTKIRSSLLGQADGVCPLGPGGVILSQYLPTIINLDRGPYDQTTNTPALVDGVGSNGDYYTLSKTGNFLVPINGYTFGMEGSIFKFSSDVGNWVLYASPNLVTSVLGLTGAVVFDSDAVTQGSINLYATVLNLNNWLANNVTTNNIVEGNLNPFYRNSRVFDFITSPAAQATTSQRGTVTLAPGSINSIVPDINLLNTTANNILPSITLIDAGTF